MRPQNTVYSKVPGIDFPTTEFQVANTIMQSLNLKAPVRLSLLLLSLTGPGFWSPLLHALFSTPSPRLTSHTLYSVL